MSVSSSDFLNIISLLISTYIAWYLFNESRKSEIIKVSENVQKVLTDVKIVNSSNESKKLEIIKVSDNVEKILKEIEIVKSSNDISKDIEEKINMKEDLESIQRIINNLNKDIDYLPTKISDKLSNSNTTLLNNLNDKFQLQIEGSQNIIENSITNILKNNLPEIEKKTVTELTDLVEYSLRTMIKSQMEIALSESNKSVKETVSKITEEITIVSEEANQVDKKLLSITSRYTSEENKSISSN